MADHWQRTQEFRKEQMQTGGHHDDQGHTPKLPNKPAVP
jgi:hypothetical protein